MKDIYKIILDLTRRKSRWKIRIIAIAPGGENYQPYFTYSVRESQSKRDAQWKKIT